MDKKIKKKLQLLASEKDPLKKSLTLLAILTEALKAYDIRPILVGGRALEFYTLGGYATRDIDLVTSGRTQVSMVLQEMGFLKRPGERHWYHEDLDLALEIPDDTLAGDIDKLTTLEIDGMECSIIGVEDLVVDRLAAAKFWKSASDAQWAARLMALHVDEIDPNYLRHAAKKAEVEDFLEKAWQQSQAYLTQ
jgi:predicted nucleotidyltransferase